MFVYLVYVLAIVRTGCWGCWCVVGVADVGVVVGSVGVGLLDLLMVCVLVGWLVYAFSFFGWVSVWIVCL